MSFFTFLEYQSPNLFDTSTVLYYILAMRFFLYAYHLYLFELTIGEDDFTQSNKQVCVCVRPSICLSVGWLVGLLVFFFLLVCFSCCFIRLFVCVGRREKQIIRSVDQAFSSSQVRPTSTASMPLG